MISKELLSEVIRIPISNNINENGIIKVIGISESELDGAIDLDFEYQDKESSHSRYINLYQLADKCKKWMLSKEYFISIKYDPRIGRTKINLTVAKDNTTIFGEESFYCDMEEDAIFQACEWILNQNK